MMDSNVVELLATQEHSSSQYRLLALEKKVQLQADEILCLKSSLADVIRRLSNVEHNHLSSTKSSHKQPPPSPSPRTLIGFKSGSNTNLSESVSPNLTTMTNRPMASRSNPKITTTTSTGQGHKQRPPSSSRQVSSTSKDSTITTTNGRSSASSSFSKEHGLVKLYLSGRPVNFYLPRSLAASFDTTTALKCPKDVGLRLEWVYGYRGKDCRSNLHDLQTGECVYFVAAVAVLFNTEERSQRHYLGHTDDIKSLAVHPDKIRVATGQCTGHDNQEGRAHVRIWDAVTLVTLRTLGLGAGDVASSLPHALFQNSICCLAFSPSGEHLACVDEAGERTLSVWRWEEAAASRPSAHTKCYGDAVICLDWHPTEANMLVSAGKQHLTVWTFDASVGMLSRKMGTFEAFASEKPKFILAIAFSISTGEIISGDSDGNIIIWSAKEAKVHKLISEAHEGGVFSILVLDNGNRIVTGGKDLRLVEWDSNWERTGRALEIPEPQGSSCRCIAPDKGSFLLVGTTKNSIYKVNFDLNYVESVIQGHSDELWGLCASTSTSVSSSSFITCGNDMRLCVWDTLSHVLVSSHTFDDKLHCAHMHPHTDSLVAIGCRGAKPKWFVYDLAERKVVFTQLEIGHEPIECIQFSPDGKYLAAGCRDNHIYVYQVAENGRKYTRVGKCQGHSSFVTHLDWSTNSEYLMSNSGDYEILYWHVSASACKQVTHPQQVRDLEWHMGGGGGTCTLAPSLLGIWTTTSSSPSTTMDGTDINAVAVAKERAGGICAFVDDFGKVNLVAYPCASLKTEKTSYRGHSSHVTNVTFVNRDSRLVTTGGNDTAVFQWNILTP